MFVRKGAAYSWFWSFINAMWVSETSLPTAHYHLQFAMLWYLILSLSSRWWFGRPVCSLKKKSFRLGESRGVCVMRWAAGVLRGSWKRWWFICLFTWLPYFWRREGKLSRFRFKSGAAQQVWRSGEDLQLLTLTLSSQFSQGLGSVPLGFCNSLIVHK